MIFVLVYLWALFFSIDLCFCSFRNSTPSWLLQFVISLEIGQCVLKLFFFSTALALLGLLTFHVNFRISLLTSTKHLHQNHQYTNVNYEYLGRIYALQHFSTYVTFFFLSGPVLHGPRENSFLLTEENSDPHRGEDVLFQAKLIILLRLRPGLATYLFCGCKYILVTFVHDIYISTFR